LVSKLAVILLMDREERIDDWSDRELMSRLALLVLSLEEGRDEVVEGSDDGGGVNSKVAVISLPFIEVDADVDMEVFISLEVAMAAANAAATLRAALIFFAYYKYSCPVDRHCASPSSAGCHHRHGASWDYQSSISERNKHCNRCVYRLCFDQNLR